MTTLVGRPAPRFSTGGVLPSGEIAEKLAFPELLDGGLGWLVFYPLDFTFVCPSELIAIDRRMGEFQARGATVCSVSVDSVYAHAAWRGTAVNAGGIGPVRFTMLADVSHDIVRAYGVEAADGVALRASFLIDQTGMVRHALVNDLPLGRNIDEMLRMTDALLHFQAVGEVCPAGWRSGEPGMEPSADGVASYLGAHAGRL